MVQLPSTHQIGDLVVLSFLPSVVRNARIEAVIFRNETVYYDVSVKMQKPEWDNAAFASLKNVHSAFVLKEGETPEYVTREQLVSFGNYLLSEERRSLYTGENVEERLSRVNHADVSNWADKHSYSVA